MSKIIPNVIDLVEAENLIKRRREINKINVMEAIFTRNGEEIEVSKEKREHWRFTGLNTIDFVDFDLGDIG